MSKLKAFEMKVENKQTFRGISPYNITAGLENNVLLNKAIFDITGSDIPWVVMANNKQERRERTNRAMLSFGLIFVSPLVILPLVNRIAMKNVKLTSKLFSEQYNAVRLSNASLKDAKATEEGLKELAKESFTSYSKKFYYKHIKKQPVPEEKINVEELLKNADGSYDKLRTQIIKAKNTVLASDFMLVTGTFGNIGFFNSWLTKRKTGQNGYSAEMGMADKSVVEKRAEKYQKTEKLRYGTFLASLAAIVVAIPLGIKHGLSSGSATKFSKFVEKHAPKFDYTDAIFMKRWPLALSLASAQLGICLASRNATELKDNAIRSSTGYAIFFGGDILLASLLSKLSDKVLRTTIIDKTKQGSGVFGKMLPNPTMMKDLAISGNKTTKTAAASIFWFNLMFLSAITGFAVPHLINKIIKKDVAKDSIPTATPVFSNQLLPKSKAFKQFQNV